MRIPPESGPSVRPASFAFPEERDTVASIDENHTVVDRHPRVLDAAGHAPAAIERHDRHLVRNVFPKRRGSRMYHCLRINSAHHNSPRIVTTQLAPEPPRFSAR